ncbi:hypothetical protein FGIG_02150 [Fasciola gigantica]|uniref:Transmembrane protein n=1 Tax=Fasciola gigantica TaxID=46835 RepID=A0A504YCX1_FASGI|nr:hypothetical protein FGIG_02150 [Fasciola gigantica]
MQRKKPDEHPSARPLLIGQSQTNNIAPAGGESQLPTSVSTALHEHRMSPDDKQASLKPIGRSPDAEMLEALKDLAHMEDVFAFPLISRFTLSFHSRPVELFYRNLGLRRPKCLAAKMLSWSTPRVAPFINAVLETIMLILILVTCLATFLDSLRAAHSPIFYVVAVIALFLQFLFLSLLIVDMIAWNSGQAGSGASGTTGCNWRGCAMRTYMVCFRWPMRDMTGAILLFLPTAVVLSNFTEAYFTGTREYSHIFVAYYRIIFRLMLAFTLFNYTLFTTFSSWTKALSACVGCAMAIFLCLLPAKKNSSLHLANDRYWHFGPIVHKYNQAGVALPA